MDRVICPAIQSTWPIHRQCSIYASPGQKYCPLHQIQTNVADFIPTQTIEQKRVIKKTFNPIINLPCK